MNWHIATLKESKYISKDIRSMFFEVPDFPSFKAGQHCDIRLTAPDGYQAQRAYSIASAPSIPSATAFEPPPSLPLVGGGWRGLTDSLLEFGVQILPDGEVSSYLDIMKIGEQLEIKGPIGGHFIWDNSINSPIILIGAGSGIVPLISILREFVSQKSRQNLLLIISVRSLQDLAWREELEEIAKSNENIELKIFLTREWPDNWEPFNTGRLNEEKYRQLISPWVESNRPPQTYICGRNDFVEVTGSSLVSIGLTPSSIKTERYG